MVEIFEVITQAMKEKKGESAADQLEYASKLLRGKSQSGSAKLYASGLSQAAQQFQEKDVTASNALTLVQSLLGGGEAPKHPSSTDNSLGSVISGLIGGGQDDDDGFDTSDLLGAGMAFLASKKSGKSNMESIVNAIVSSSKMGSSQHRSDSGTLVTNTLLDVISSLTN